MGLRSWMITLLAVCTAIASAQSWIGEYDKGLDSAKKGDWTAARSAFQQAVAYRPEDTDKATTLPGPVTEVRRWRNGAAYSPNFLAAYAGYRQGMSEADQARATALSQAASELEMLLEKGQTSREAFYFLNAIYTTLGDTAKRQSLESKFTALGGKANFKVDTEVVSPEELAQINKITSSKSNEPNVTKVPSTQTTGQPTKIGGTSGSPLNPVGPVNSLPNKYALIIGNGDSQMKDLALPYAADDAQQLREALVNSAGYSEQNVDLVLNATAEQILKSAEALSQRVDENAIVLIYFSGVGVNVDGKDFLAGIDSESATDTSSMVSKHKLFELFLAKGSKVFSFFQANRPIVAGQYFGKEIPYAVGLSQMQATIPGDTVFSYIRNSKSVGLFTSAMIRVINEQKSNQLPILDFGWQVFNKMRRGDTGTTGGSSRQSCTLPVLTNLAADARF